MTLCALGLIFQLGQNSDRTPQSEDHTRLRTELQKSVDHLRAELQDARAEWTKLGDKLRAELQAERMDRVKAASDVAVRLSFLELFGARRHMSAWIDPASRGFEMVDTSIGTLLVSCQAVRPYLDGSQVDLRLGNPMFAGLSGFTLKLKWGPRSEGKAGDAQHEAWLKSLKSTEVKFTKELEAGRWNLAQVVLSETPPDRLGAIFLKIAADVVSLKKQPGSP
jgi:hypothetical protein